ncbi:MAG TPA: hypothetical protein VLM85_27675 [Polyangiaceae bacterium]|nr:hypothetical protein [Polyangiaceae bacterium]
MSMAPSVAMTADDQRRRGWHRAGRIALDSIALLLVLGAVALVVAPIFISLDTYGIHDWDQMEAHRYLAVKTIKRFHQFPFWNPYSCGGHTWWGGLESGSNLVSPWFPAYLLLSLPLALRVEVVGATLLSAVGTWLLAGRFTRSAGLRLLVVAAFTIDSRFTEQIAVGHTWHLYYAWTPWALFFLDRAMAIAPAPWSRVGSALGDVVACGAMLAMMVYTGGIYPLPQTIFVIACYSTASAWAARSWRPILVAVASGLLSFAFAAPRLLPVLDMLRHYPRLVDSTESMDLTGLIGVYTSKGPGHPVLGPWGWHEFGIYTGWIPVLLMVFALFFAARARERALRLAGALCVLLALGRFSDYAPWALLHDYVPVFESQHVPSRWLYPATLLLVIAAVAVIERFLARQSRRGWLELSLLFVGAYVALDVGLEAQRPLVGAFARKMAPIEEKTTGFHQERSAPSSLRYDVSDWAPPAMPAMRANVGLLECETFLGLDSYYRDRKGRIPGLGAHAQGDPEYRGEVYFADGRGDAQILSWTPNEVVVHYDGATAGDVLVMNQNWDPGWHADGGAIPWVDLVATHVPGPRGEITFRYRPRFLWLGILVFTATVAALVMLRRRLATTLSGRGSVASS